MDMQGTPIGSTNQGMKNTSDPERYQNPIKEGAGAVASDSLAAESTRSGGAFSSNRDSEPQSVSGSKSTFANTDTSGAETLAPAPAASERDTETGDQAQKYPEAAGKAEFPGSHSAQGYAGGPTSAKQEMSSGNSSSTYHTSSSGSTGGSSSTGNTSSTGNPSSTGNSSFTGANSSADNISSTTGGSSHVDTAPGYVASVVSNPGQSGKPHGKNITEGGFDIDDSKNASFNSEIGSKNDPGRKAENDFQAQTQSASGATGPRQYGGQGGSTYGVLDTDQSL